MKVIVVENRDLGYFEIEPLEEATEHSVILDLPPGLILRRNKAVADFEETADELRPLVRAEQERMVRARYTEGEWEEMQKGPALDQFICKTQERGPRSKARQPLPQLVPRP